METFNHRLPNSFRREDGTVVENATYRLMTGDEQNWVRHKENINKGNVFYKMLRRCLVSFDHDEDPNVLNGMFDRMPAADATDALILLRQKSIKDLYEFPFKCPTCSFTSSKAMPLSSLRYVERDPKYRGERSFTDTVKFEDTELDPATGELVTVTRHPSILMEWRHNLVGDAAFLDAARLNNPQETATQELVQVVQTIDGVKPSANTFKSMSWGQIVAILHTMDSVTSGRDVELELYCRNCESEVLQRLQVHTADFFFPKASKSTPRKTDLARYRKNG